VSAAYQIIDLVFWLLNIAVLARVLFSWLRPDPSNRLARLVYDVTEPILAPLRRYIKPIGGWDITPVVAIVLLDLLERLLFGLLR